MGRIFTLNVMILTMLIEIIITLLKIYNGFKFHRVKACQNILWAVPDQTAHEMYSHFNLEIGDLK